MGIFIAPTSGATNVSISNTIASDNSVGIAIQPFGTAKLTGVISQTTAANNLGAGISIDNSGAGGSATIVDSVAFNNGNAGFWAFTGATMRIGRSVATGNGFGVGISGGVVESFGDNNLRGNVSGAVSGGSLTKVAAD